jgi:hypothetical protein
MSTKIYWLKSLPFIIEECKWISILLLTFGWFLLQVSAYNTVEQLSEYHDFGARCGDVFLLCINEITTKNALLRAKTIWK